MKRSEEYLVFMVGKNWKLCFLEVNNDRLSLKATLGNNNHMNNDNYKQIRNKLFHLERKKVN
jgi:hypothetical protein